MKKFQRQSRNVSFHIDSKFSTEMAQMSTIVRFVCLRFDVECIIEVYYTNCDSAKRIFNLF